MRISGFLGLIRLHNHRPIITAYSYNANTDTTTGIILSADEAEMKAIKEHINYYESFIGHELLLRTIFIEMSLEATRENLSELKQDVMDIEHSTGQHTWDNYRTRKEEPLPDIELSRLAHSARSQAAFLCRRIEVALLWIELLSERLTQDQKRCASRLPLLQWLRNLETQAKMAKVDAEWNAKRAENQVGAVSNAYPLPLCSTPGCALRRYTSSIAGSPNEITLQPRRYPRPPTVILPP